MSGKAAKARLLHSARAVVCVGMVGRAVGRAVGRDVSTIVERRILNSTVGRPAQLTKRIDGGGKVGGDYV